jgi:hypothetical protein
MRPTMTRSDWIGTSEGAIRSRMFFSRAAGVNSTSTLSSSSRAENTVGRWVHAPLSSREISSSADMISSTVLSEASMLRASGSSAEPEDRSIRVEV